MNKINTPLYWTQLTHGEWSMYLAATPDGLCYVGSPNQPFGQLSDWAKARLTDRALIRDDAQLKPYAQELTEYLQGARHDFALPADLFGTPFQLAVWHALRSIPYGKTLSYSDIAGLIGKPAAVRAVGAAIGANPVLIAVPCHRVIGKSGALTGYRGGMAMKTELLQLERNGIGAVTSGARYSQDILFHDAK